MVLWLKHSNRSQKTQAPFLQLLQISIVITMSGFYMLRFSIDSYRKWESSVILIKVLLKRALERAKSIVMAHIYLILRI